eukprot:gene6248-4497_t
MQNNPGAGGYPPPPRRSQGDGGASATNPYQQQQQPPNPYAAQQQATATTEKHLRQPSVEGRSQLSQEQGHGGFSGTPPECRTLYSSEHQDDGEEKEGHPRAGRSAEDATRLHSQAYEGSTTSESSAEQRRQEIIREYIAKRQQQQAVGSCVPATTRQQEMPSEQPTKAAEQQPPQQQSPCVTEVSFGLTFRRTKKGFYIYWNEKHEKVFLDEHNRLHLLTDGYDSEEEQQETPHELARRCRDQKRREEEMRKKEEEEAQRREQEAVREGESALEALVQSSSSLLGQLEQDIRQSIELLDQQYQYHQQFYKQQQQYAQHTQYLQQIEQQYRPSQEQLSQQQREMSARIHQLITEKGRTANVEQWKKRLDNELLQQQQQHHQQTVPMLSALCHSLGQLMEKQQHDYMNTIIEQLEHAQQRAVYPAYQPRAEQQHQQQQQAQYQQQHQLLLQLQHNNNNNSNIVKLCINSLNISHSNSTACIHSSNHSRGWGIHSSNHSRGWGIHSSNHSRGWGIHSSNHSRGWGIHSSNHSRGWGIHSSNHSRGWGIHSSNHSRGWGCLANFPLRRLQLGIPLPCHPPARHSLTHLLPDIYPRGNQHRFLHHRQVYPSPHHIAQDSAVCHRQQDIPNPRTRPPVFLHLHVYHLNPRMAYPPTELDWKRSSPGASTCGLREKVVIFLILTS